MWYYFPLALALKVPLGAWGRARVGLPALARLAPGRRGDAVIYLLLPACVYFGLALTVRTQIGLRHVLPVLPFLFALAGVGAQWLWAKGRVGRAALGVLLTSHVVASLWVAPNYLSHFNLAAGGARQGHHWFDDSNVDWGQDLPTLSRWYRALKARDPEVRVAVLHFGPFPAAFWDAELPVLRRDSYPFEMALPDWDYLAISQHLIPRMLYQVRGAWGLPFRWDEDERIRGWIRNSYAVHHLREAEDGSGDVVIAGEAPLRIPREEWLAEAQANIAKIEQRISRRRSPRNANLVRLRWQSARFFERWGDSEEAAAHYEALDQLLRSSGGRGEVDLDRSHPGLREDLIRHWTEIGRPDRARF
jgi:hypothetical protein